VAQGELYWGHPSNYSAGDLQQKTGVYAAISHPSNYSPEFALAYPGIHFTKF